MTIPRFMPVEKLIYLADSYIFNMKFTINNTTIIIETNSPMFSIPAGFILECV